MAADETAAVRFAPRSVREDARRVWRASWILLLLAAAIWGWFGYLLLAPWGPEVTGSTGTPERLCQGILIEPLPGNNACHNELRQWPPLVGILALAAITSIAAAATTVYALILSRLTRSGTSVHHSTRD